MCTETEYEKRDGSNHFGLKCQVVGYEWTSNPTEVKNTYKTSIVCTNCRFSITWYWCHSHFAIICMCVCVSVCVCVCVCVCVLVCAVLGERAGGSGRDVCCLTSQGGHCTPLRRYILYIDGHYSDHYCSLCVCLCVYVCVCVCWESRRGVECNGRESRR